MPAVDMNQETSRKLTAIVETWTTNGKTRRTRRDVVAQLIDQTYSEMVQRGYIKKEAPVER